MKHMENLAVQGLTNSPFNTFPCGAINSLTDLGYPREAPSLTITNTAALARTALTSAAFATARDRFYSDDLPDDALLHPREVPWLADSSFMALLDAYNQMHKLPLRISDLPVTYIQGHLSAALRKAVKVGPWPSLLHRRLQRFVPEVTGDEVANTMKHINDMSGRMPHSMVLNFLRIILNGLPTAARTQGGNAPCLLCGWPGGDRIEHILHCTVLAHVVADKCNAICLFPGPVLRHRVVCLVIPGMSLSIISDVCVLCNVLYSVDTARRHGAPKQAR
jgi:hypothetical protein